jgi:hypothetical protein
MDFEIAEFQVEFVMLATRPKPWLSGIRPNHKHPLTGDYFFGAMEFGPGIAYPGKPVNATVRLSAPPDYIEFIRGFGSWTIWEGPHHAGSVRVIGENKLDTNAPDDASGTTD